MALSRSEEGLGSDMTGLEGGLLVSALIQERSISQTSSSLDKTRALIMSPPPRVPDRDGNSTRLVVVFL